MNKNVSQLKLGVLLSYISRIIQTLVGLLYTPIMIRLLGQSEYGLYNIATSTIAYLGVLNFGFGSAYMRFYSRYKVKEDTEKIAILNGMFLVIFSILGVIIVIAGVVLALNVDLIFGPSLSTQELVIARLLILILVVNLAISFPVIVFNTYLQANEKFIFQNFILIIRQITTPLINLPLLLAGYGSVGMVTGTVIINIIMEVIIVSYCFKKMNIKFAIKNFDHDLMKEMTIYSSYIFMNMIVDQINNNMDKTILGRYQGTVSVAIYSVAASLKEYYTQISTTISAVFIPRIHRMVAGNTNSSDLTFFFTRIGRIQFILVSLVMSGFIFFGRPFIGIWAGENYYVSYIVALLLMLPLTIDLIQNTSIEIQRAKNMHKVRSWLYVILATGNLIISIPLAKKYGAIGGALGTSISFFLGNGIFMNFYNHLKVGLNMKYFWKEIFKFFPAFIGPIIYGVIVNQVIDLYNIRNLILYGFIYVLLFIISIWLLGMNDYERELFRKPFN